MSVGKNYWRQFEEWVIDLKHDPFQSARIKLTFFYIVILIIAIVFYLALLSRELNRHARLFASETIPDPGKRATFIRRSDTVVQTTLFRIDPEDVGMFFFVVGLSYILAAITLRPIKRALQQQEEFMVNISHELRTPLTILQTEFETFLRSKKNYATKNVMLRKKQTVVSNLEEVQRMRQILEELSLVANIDSKKEIFHFSIIDINTLLKKTINVIKSYAAEKQIELQYHESKPIYLQADSEKLQQAFLNILKNAIDYSRNKSSVIITLKKKMGTILIVFKDSGIGIGKEELPFVFDRFFRGASNGTSGTGLGLSIVKWVINNHRGDISIQSEIGSGTTITVSLPIVSS